MVADSSLAEQEHVLQIRMFGRDGLAAVPALFSCVAAEALGQDAARWLVHEVLPVTGERQWTELRAGATGLVGLETEPIDLMSAQGQRVRPVRDFRETTEAEHLSRKAAQVLAEFELRVLSVAREIGDDQNSLFPVLAQEGQHFGVTRAQKAQLAATQYAVAFAHRDQLLGRPQE